MTFVVLRVSREDPAISGGGVNGAAVGRDVI